MLPKNSYVVALQARATPPKLWCSRPDHSALADMKIQSTTLMSEYQARSQLLQTAVLRQQLFFPDRRLIQFDCGKLQVRADVRAFNLLKFQLLQGLTAGNQRCSPSRTL